MAEVNRKSVASLIRAYGEVNPEAVVRLMSQYADIEEKKAAEEAEETRAQYDMIGQLGTGAMENLQDFRTATAGGYEGGYFKFLTEKPENIAKAMDAGKANIEKASGREKELMTALFPKAKQKHFDRIDRKAEKYGVSGEDYQNMTFKERRKLKKDFQNNQEIDSVTDNSEEILLDDNVTSLETNYTDNKITNNIENKTSDMLSDNNLDSSNVLNLKNNTNFKIDDIKLDTLQGFNAENSDTTSMFNNFEDINLSSNIPDTLSTIKLDDTYGPTNDIFSEDIKDLKIENDNVASGIMSGIKSLFGFG